MSPHAHPLHLQITLKSKFIDTRGKTKAQVKKARREGHAHRLAQAEYVQKLLESRFKGEHDSAL